MKNPNVLGRAATFVVKRRNKNWHVVPGQEPPHMVLGIGSLPKYARDRLEVARSRRSSEQDKAWLVADANALIEEFLEPTHRAIEFGSGSSTAWLADQVGHLTSVEDSTEWHTQVVAQIQASNRQNVDLHLVSSDELGRDTDAHREAYVSAGGGIPSGSLDFALVDGLYRDRTAMRAIELLAPGGMLVLDNSNLYLPSPSRSPWKVERPATPLFEVFAGAVASWRHLWLTNGVWDTAVWFKPEAS